MSDVPRVRIAPSPTGSPQIGNARTALFNYLFAKRSGGSFVLRIEDTDLERSDKKYEQEIFDAFQWLGLVPDEGPEQGGPYAPYRQTDRIALYQKYVRQLLKEGKAFYCFHSEKDLAREKDGLMAEKRPTLHLCEFRTLDPDEAELLTETKSDYIIRFKTAADRVLTFHDMIRGPVKFDSSLLGDFSIAKRVDVPLYNFAVVVDDIEMGITHVIRGEDHIPNTPKQLLLFDALQASPPQFAHLPLILGPDRSKLSKRHGATAVTEYREQGYLPEALFNFMALLGWNPGGNQEIFSKEELISLFSLEKVQKSPAIFDTQKLDWINGEYIRKKYLPELVSLTLPFLKDFLNFSLPNSRFPIEYLQKVVALEQPRLKKLSEIGERTDYFFREPEYEKELLRWRNMTDVEIVNSLELNEKILLAMEPPISKEILEKIFLLEGRVRMTMAQKIGGSELGGGDIGRLLWPLRVALSGKKASPSPFEILAILGVKEALRRLAHARKKLEQ